MSTSTINLINGGLDVGTIVDSLIYVASAPVRNLQNQVTTLKSRVSAYQSLNTKLSALADKVNTMLFGDSEPPLLPPATFYDKLSAGIFAASLASSSNSDLISAAASNAAAEGSYSVTVNCLAQARSMASSGFADAASVETGTGTITITTGSGDPVVITISDLNNTLSGIRDAINSASAGVTATIINDGSLSPFRLLIRANETGIANSFTITDTLAGGQALDLVQTQAAADAQFILNGVAISKSTNTISDVISGVSFTLKDVSAAPVSISVERDLDSVVSALQEFVSAYNAVNSFINSQFSYDSSSGSAGALSGDSTLRRIQSTLQSQMAQSVSNSFTSYDVAGQIGIDFNRDGSLTLDEGKVRAALSSDYTGVAALFLGDGMPGILGNVANVLDGITDPLSGPIQSATDGLNRNIVSLNDSIDTYQDRLDREREMLTAQFNQADEALRLLTLIQAQFTSQINALSS